MGDEKGHCQLVSPTKFSPSGESIDSIEIFVAIDVFSSYMNNNAKRKKGKGFLSKLKNPFPFWFKLKIIGSSMILSFYDIGF